MVCLIDTPAARLGIQPDALLIGDCEQHVRMARLTVEFAKAREIKPAQFVLHYLDRDNDVGTLVPSQLASEQVPFVESRRRCLIRHSRFPYLIWVAEDRGPINDADTFRLHPVPCAFSLNSSWHSKPTG